MLSVVKAKVVLKLSLSRSNHAVWNDLFVGFLLPKVFAGNWKFFGWYRLSVTIWRAELSLCRFLSASSDCCRWFQIIFISGLFFDSDCFFDYTRLWITSAWLYPRWSVPCLFSTCLDFFFGGSWEGNCKSFNINAQKPKFDSSTVVYFTLADLLGSQ